MSNFELLIFYTFIDFFILFLAFRLFGKKGVTIFIIISLIAANIQVNKAVEYNIFGLHIIATLGNVMFGGIFMANDLLNEKYGRSEARRVVLISVFFGISFILLMLISTFYQTVSNDEFYKKSSNALDFFFSLSGGALKAVIIGNLVYLISQLFDVLIYAKLKSYSNGIKWLWFRNTTSTLVSQIIDTVLITYSFAFAGIIPMQYALEVVFSTLLIKYIIAIINAPLFYLLAFIKPKNS
ncbi:queuosine precursor transporter [Allofrancisella guangzhouensis]|uniref:Probable queuosine precursor transporter n=1 Tax=Allofrancisella guangzhouensis TaxID=594679 RepID=A0A0A8E4D3_9GAMM|nr:queuosine precursor transporter [Allofrancisella guangzhouensis]AJC48824.1 hypothetical protein SD28_03840 [Allofrancisella guangzhouensis]MBK2027279.1 queuosine precursor transporter [Allofrancisella guangzhouensis]MBK2044733.1 queuosine precursor transporter [Allofrancisella guangzhouensis]MBK2045925.1 queuosine precursor transporter [Allofrancisella guangzhouensis]